jgi:hypothetical protein
MDLFAHDARMGSPCAGNGIPGSANRCEVAAIPGGQVERRQLRNGDHLNQTVEVRRRDGSVWTAYARQLALPADPGEADRTTELASCVLDLLARAVAAADTARQARGAMLDPDAAPPWAAHYG